MPEKRDTFRLLSRIFTRSPQKCPPRTDAPAAGAQKMLLPAGARRYIDFVAETVEVPVDIVSVGPGREQTIIG